jgi:hypothetical protein
MERSTNIEVHQDVVILRIAEDDDEVEVDVFGTGLAGTVAYEFPDEEHRRAQLVTLRHWEQEGTRLVYVRREGEVALLDDAARFADSWSGCNTT